VLAGAAGEPVQPEQMALIGLGSNIIEGPEKMKTVRENREPLGALAAAAASNCRWQL